LSRGKAAELIITNEQLPQAEPTRVFKKYYVGQSSATGRTALIHYGYTEDYSQAKPMLDALEAKGAIRVRQDAEHRNGISYQWAVVELTPDGRRHLMVEDGAEYQVKAYETHLGSVTGIQIDKHSSIATATYTLIRKNFTVFASSESQGGVLSRSTSFALFDDGWRTR